MPAHSHSLTLCYCAAGDIAPASEGELTQLLDTNEQARYQRMRAEAGQRFVQGRRMVRTLLSEQLGQPPEALTFNYSENGKPSLAFDPRWQFSISHCAQSVAVAIGKAPMGLDIESIHRRHRKANTWRKAASMMHATTAAHIAQCSTNQAKTECFTLLWTLLESQVKLADSSIFRALKNLAIELYPCADNHSRAAVAKSAESFAGGACYWWAFEGLNEDIVTLATRERIHAVELKQWTKEGQVHDLTLTTRLKS